jgi:hypothetical protein
MQEISTRQRFLLRAMVVVIILMRSVRRAVCALLLGGMLPVPRSAAADPFTPSHLFTVQFSTRAVDYPAQLGVPDVLAFFVLTTVVEPVDMLTVRLFDRGELRGTYSSAQLDDPPGFADHAAGYFIAPGSSFRFGNPTTINFSSLRDGTFDGRVEFSIANGLIDLQRNAFSVFLGTSQPNGEAIGINIAPAPVPEPGTMLVVLGGLAAGAPYARRRRRIG